VINLRETIKNRRATFANTSLQSTLTEEWQLRYIEVLNWQWSDFDDFKKKYDTSVSPLNFDKRQSILVSQDAMGRMYREGLIDLDAFGDAAGFGVVVLWLKFKPIIEGYREWVFPKDSYSGFEYLANALLKRISDSDPDFMRKMDMFFTIPPVDQ
jgi:hypothetical protein